MTETSEFESWAKRIEPRLRRALAGARAPADVADAVAEALLYAWREWDRVRVMENPIGYLFRVGLTRTRTRKQADLPSPADLGAPDFEPRLVPALKALPECQRVAVWLVHACGFTQVETADAMGVSPSTVSTHVARGLASLRRDLEVRSDV